MEMQVQIATSFFLWISCFLMQKRLCYLTFLLVSILCWVRGQKDCVMWLLIYPAFWNNAICLHCSFRLLTGTVRPEKTSLCPGRFNRKLLRLDSQLWADSLCEGLHTENLGLNRRNMQLQPNKSHSFTNRQKVFIVVVGSFSRGAAVDRDSYSF